MTRLVTTSSSYSATGERPIGFLDSGVGGLPYLARTRELLPDERFVYFADRGHFPYGERPVAEVRRIVHDAVENLVRRAEPKMMCVACNTASVVSLEDLRSAFNIPFVGVVPAIKPAGMIANGGRIGVLATSRTVEDPYVSALIRQFATNSTVVLVAAGSLVEHIESDLVNLTGRRLSAFLAEPVAQLKRERVDVVVLGCTHFIHIRDHLAAMLGNNVPVVDSVDGVARQVARVCWQVGASPFKTGEDELFVQDAHAAGYQGIARRYHLALRTDARVG